MKSKTTSKFWELYRSLPVAIQNRAKNAYLVFQQTPHNPGLKFKRVHPKLPIYSARISKNYRAVGIIKEHSIIWFWIGSHTDDDHLLKSLN